MCLTDKNLSEKQSKPLLLFFVLHTKNSTDSPEWSLTVRESKLEKYFFHKRTQTVRASLT